MTDQAQELRALMRLAAPRAASAQAGPRTQPAPRESHLSVSRSVSAQAVAESSPRWVVVGGGKGGTGITTVAANLAASLSLAGHRVALLDGDSHRPDVATLCGIAPGAALADWHENRRDLHEILTPAPAGLQVLPGPWSRRALAEPSPESLERLIAELSGSGAYLDFIVVDAGAALTPTTQRFWRQADHLLLVAAVESLALIDAYTAVKILLGEGNQPPLATLVNFATDEADALSVFERLTCAARRFLGRTIDLAGYLLSDPRIERSDRPDGLFVCRDAALPATQTLAKLADAILARRPATRGLGGESPRFLANSDLRLNSVLPNNRYKPNTAGAPCTVKT